MTEPNSVETITQMLLWMYGIYTWKSVSICVMRPDSWSGYNGRPREEKRKRKIRPRHECFPLNKWPLTIELRNYILALGFERLTLGAMLAFIHSHRDNQYIIKSISICRNMNNFEWDRVNKTKSQKQERTTIPTNTCSSEISLYRAKKKNEIRKMLNL